MSSDVNKFVQTFLYLFSTPPACEYACNRRSFTVKNSSQKPYLPANVSKPQFDRRLHRMSQKPANLPANVWRARILPPYVPQALNIAGECFESQNFAVVRP